MDENVETKTYSDGTQVTGTAPLPDQSPAQQDAPVGDGIEHPDLQQRIDALAAERDKLLEARELDAADILRNHERAEKAEARVTELSADLEAARAEFVSGELKTVTHSDDELCNRWIAAGGMAEDYTLAVRFARSL